MGGLAEERVREAVRSLTDRDAAALDAVLTGDEPINDLHIENDDRCFKLNVANAVLGRTAVRPCVIAQRELSCASRQAQTCSNRHPKTIPQPSNWNPNKWNMRAVKHA